MNFLFNGGCIWGFFEYIGAIQYIKEKGLKIGKLYGVSAGSAIALCVLLDIDIRELIQFIERTVQETKFQSLTAMHLLGVKFTLENRPDAYKLANNRLFVGLTNADGFYFKSRFSSNDDLANALICGGTVPLLSTYDSICENQRTVDGGIGFTTTHIPKHTIIIRPTTPFPLSAIPPPELLQKLLIQLGYRNAEHFITAKNNRIGDMWYSKPEYLPLWLYLAKPT
jgi:hypothetical protein